MDNIIVNLTGIVLFANEDWGLKLRRLRKDMGLSLSQAGSANGTLCRVELHTQNEHVRLGTLIRYCAKLNLKKLTIIFPEGVYDYSIKYSSLPDFLKRARIAKGLNQADIPLMDKSTVSLMERSKVSSGILTYINYLKALEVKKITISI